MSTKQIVSLAFVVVVVLLAVTLGGKVVETNMAGYMQVKQEAITGDLTCRLNSGMYGQWFGTISTYSEAETFYFTADEEQGQARNESLPARFNDGAKALVSGSLRVLLPRDCEQLKLLHRKFHSMNGVMNKLVLPAVTKALFNTGPHMSAGESYAERRGEFASLAADQLSWGVIQVDKKQEKRPDPITGEEKMVWVIEKRVCTEGSSEECHDNFVRDRSAFEEFGINITNFVIDGINYCPDRNVDPNAPCPVLDQIETQRTARMNIITQQAQAKEADARASKAVADAKAKIAETRANEEVAKTEIIVREEAKKEKARLERDAAEYTKQKEILLGQGEAERKRLVLAADGALEKKLATYENVMGKAFTSMAAYKGNWVPEVVMTSDGKGGPGSHNAATDLLEMFSVKVARDLSLDMKVPKGTQSRQ